MKMRRIKVSYVVNISDQEYKALVALGREWGLDYDTKTTVARPLQIAKRALRNSGESGCLSLIPTNNCVF